MQNIPLQFGKLMAGWDGKNASLLKFNILSDVDGERLRLACVLAQSHVLNKNNGLKFVFLPVSAMFLFSPPVAPWWVHNRKINVSKLLK